MKITDLSAYLPHRPPIVVPEKVIDIEPGRSGTGIRHFRADDSFFQGHFPDYPILPGIYIIEAFAQTALVVLMAGSTETTSVIGFLAKIDSMSYYRKIEPEQTVTFSTTIAKTVGAFVFVDCLAEVSGERCAQGQLILSTGKPT